MNNAILSTRKRHIKVSDWLKMAGLLTILGLGFSVMWVTTEDAIGSDEQGAPAATTSSRRGTSSTNKDSSTAKLEKKLDQILANQEQILKRFDDVMEELRIVKIRATS